MLWTLEGVTTGATLTTFNPNGICSSAHIVPFLWQANGKPSTSASGIRANAYSVQYYTARSDGETARAFSPTP